MAARVKVRPPRHLRAVRAEETLAPAGRASDWASLGRMLVHAVDHHVTDGLAERRPGESAWWALNRSGRLLALAMMAPSGNSREILEPWLNVTAHAAAPQLRRQLAVVLGPSDGQGEGA